MTKDYDAHIKTLKHAAQTSAPAVKKETGKPYDWENEGAIDNAIAGPLLALLVMMVGVIVAGYLSPYLTTQGLWALAVLYTASVLVTLVGAVVAIFGKDIMDALYCFAFALGVIALAAASVLVCHFFWVYVPGVVL